MNKVRISAPSEFWEKYIYRHYIKGIRTQCLGKLILLMYIISHDIDEGGMVNVLKERITNDIRKKWGGDMQCNLVVIEIEEIMEILGVSRRAAIDYRDTVKMILLHWCW